MIQTESVIENILKWTLLLLENRGTGIIVSQELIDRAECFDFPFLLNTIGIHIRPDGSKLTEEERGSDPQIEWVVLTPDWPGERWNIERKQRADLVQKRRDDLVSNQRNESPAEEKHEFHNSQKNNEVPPKAESTQESILAEILRIQRTNEERDNQRHADAIATKNLLTQYGALANEVVPIQRLPSINDGPPAYEEEILEEEAAPILLGARVFNDEYDRHSGDHGYDDSAGPVSPSQAIQDVTPAAVDGGIEPSNWADAGGGDDQKRKKKKKKKKKHK